MLSQSLYSVIQSCLSPQSLSITKTKGNSQRTIVRMRCFCLRIVILSWSRREQVCRKYQLNQSSSSMDRSLYPLTFLLEAISRHPITSPIKHMKREQRLFILNTMLSQTPSSQLKNVSSSIGKGWGKTRVPPRWISKAVIIKWFRTQV